MRRGKHQAPPWEPKSRGRARGLWSLLIAVGMLMALLPMAGAFAEHTDGPLVDPTFVAGNPTCGELGFDYELKVEPVVDGTYTKVFNQGEDDEFTATVTIDVNGAFVDFFDASPPLEAVFVKGGPNGNLYEYDPAVDHDNNLSAPINPSNGNPYGLSHISFCFGDAPITPEGALSVTKTAETSYTRTHLWDIDKNADKTVLDLAIDGSGDSLVTWTVDVTYEGFEDSAITVEGEIEITTTGQPALIETLSDVLTTPAAETSVSLDCGDFTLPDDLPILLPVNETLTCTYEVALSTTTDGVNVATATGTFTQDGSPFDEFGDAVVEFGDPDPETNATVSVSDDTGGAAEVFLGTVEAPNDDQFSYSQSFAYADYGQENCGTHTIHNTATIDQTGQSDDETVVINVQCLIFQGETATGDGLPWSDVGATRRDRVNTWFQYSPFGITEDDIVTGKNLTDIGDFTYDGSEICFDLDDPWVFADVSGNAKIEPLDTPPTSYIAPGQFDVHATLSGDSGCVDVPEADYGYAIHLDVGQWVPDPNF